MSAPDINYEEWKAALQDARQRKTDIIAEGWITRVQYEQATGLGQSQARNDLSELVTTGAAERRNFKILRNGSFRSIAHYRLKQKGT